MHVGWAGVSALQAVIECDHTYMRLHCGSCLVQNGTIPMYSLPIKYASLQPCFLSHTHTFPRPFEPPLQPAKPSYSLAFTQISLST